jgi:aspartate racemase
MKTVGIIGGIGPESTIEYYRQIVDAYRERQSGTSVTPVNHAQDARATRYPSIIINSVDLSKLVHWVGANELEAFTDYLAAELARLARAGADFAALAANTPHLVFDELQKRSSIPLLSIIEATYDEARSMGLKRVALFGTRFTMQARFYPDVFIKAGIALVVPTTAEQDFIHEKYLGELLNNIFLAETRQRLLAIVDRMKAADEIEAVILGGTELPLLLSQPQHNGIPFLDTTRIHVHRIVAELCS